MNKKYGIFYNEQFNTLLLNFDNSKIVNKVEEYANVIVLKNNNDIIGINIFNIPNNLKLKSGMYSENDKVIQFIEPIISKYIRIKQDVQFKIGKVIDCEVIEGTHLHKLLVQTDELLQIVCGAKNIAKDLTVVVATINSYMPNGDKILDGKLRGIDSKGMICSTTELNINNKFNQDGIIELPKNYQDKIGQSFWKEYYKENA